MSESRKEATPTQTNILQEAATTELTPEQRERIELNRLKGAPTDLSQLQKPP